MFSDVILQALSARLSRKTDYYLRFQNTPFLTVWKALACHKAQQLCQALTLPAYFLARPIVSLMLRSMAAI